MADGRSPIVDDGDASAPSRRRREEEEREEDREENQEPHRSRDDDDDDGDDGDDGDDDGESAVGGGGGGGASERGAVVDRSDDDDDDDDVDDEDSSDDGSDDDDDGSSLFSRDALRRHGIAALAAFVAAAIGAGADVRPLLRWSSSSSRRDPSAPRGPPPPPGGFSSPSSLSSGHAHVRAHRRTSNLNFCFGLEGDDDGGGGASSDAEEEVRRRRRPPSHDDDDENADPTLRPFEFRVPPELASAMVRHCAADDARDDDYSIVLREDDEDGDAGGNDGGVVVDPNLACLLRRLRSDDEKKSKSSSFAAGGPLVGTSVAYVRPDVSTFYLSDSEPDDASPATEASLSHTGFAAKFVNLSSKPVRLYWDGRPRSKYVGSIRPFESIGTAVPSPGQSFYVTPTYDVSHALKRWVLTNDEARAIYDPYRSSASETTEEKERRERELSKLSRRERRMYDMRLLDEAYARDYLVKTGRTWLSNFPRPTPVHFMWTADFVGQVRTIVTMENQFVEMPPERMMGRLEHDDAYERSVANAPLLGNYRARGELKLTMQVASCAPRVFEVSDFLSDVETDHLLALAKTGRIEMKASTVLPDGTADRMTAEETAQTDAETRSSTTGWIERSRDPIVDAIHRRAADLLRIDESLLRHRRPPDDVFDDDDGGSLPKSTAAQYHSIAESMQIVKYEKGQGYSAHHDFLYPSMVHRYQPSRFATVLFYLDDDGLAGGETIFPRAINKDRHDGMRIRPKRGKAALFYNVLPDGNVDDLSQHAGGEVTEGAKWLANLWVWDPIVD